MTDFIIYHTKRKIIKFIILFVKLRLLKENQNYEESSYNNSPITTFLGPTLCAILS